MKEPPAQPVPSLSGDDIRLVMIMWSIPLVPGILILIEWLIAWATLGRMPEPVVDDPKRISAFSSFLHLINGLSLFAVFPAVGMGAGVCLLRWGMGARTLAVAGIALMMAVGLVAALSQTSLKALEWWHPK